MSKQSVSSQGLSHPGPLNQPRLPMSKLALGPPHLPVPPQPLISPSSVFQDNPFRVAPYLSSEGSPISLGFDNALDKHQNSQTYSGICPLTPNINSI